MVFRRAAKLVYADRMRFDEARGMIVAEGHVSAVDGKTVVSCERLTLRVPELVGGVANAEIRVKAKEPLLMPKAPDPRTWARRAGRDEMILDARRLERVDARSFEVEDGAFTACDCGDDTRPSWRIRASHASVDLDSGAFLQWPVFYVQDVPIFALPAFYLPLGDRRSGLLAPRLMLFSDMRGALTVTQPFYWALGRSYDLTFDASYLSSRGFGTAVEGRYAPSERTRGFVKANVLFDFGERQPNGLFQKKRSSPIVRYALTGTHDTRFSHSRIRSDLNLVLDPQYIVEFGDQFVSRQAEYARSRATWSFNKEPGLRGTIGLNLMQELRPVWYSQNAADPRTLNLLSSTVPGPGEIRYRFLEMRLDMAPRPMASLPFVTEATLTGQVLAAPRPEVLRFARADLRPQWSWPMNILGLFVLEPSVAGRITVWAGHQDGASALASRAAVIGRARLFTEFTKAYGNMIHRVRPEFDYLLIPKVWGGLEAFQNDDEISQLSSVSQVRARLLSDFWSQKDGRRVGGLVATMGRDAKPPASEAESGKGVSELVVEGDWSFTPGFFPFGLTLEALLAFDTKQKQYTEFQGGISLFARGGHRISARFGRFRGTLPQYSFVAPEELVPSRTIDTGVYLPLAEYRSLGAAPEDEPRQRDVAPYSAFKGLNLSVTSKPLAFVRALSPLSLAFDAGFTFEHPDEDISGSAVLRNLSLALRWDSPCRCWNGTLTFRTQRVLGRLESPSFGFSIDLARLGGVGTSF